MAMSADSEGFLELALRSFFRQIPKLCCPLKANVIERQCQNS
jgi:hypothetical protein